MFTISGTFLEIFGQGVLIKGESGSGKSVLALELIHRGHRLVSDDAVCFEKRCEKIFGRCPPQTQDFMYIEELGIVNIRKMFGSSALSLETPLHLIISLSSHIKQKSGRLSGSYESTSILGVTIPTLPIRATPAISTVLIETSVHNQMLQSQGYCAAEAFNAQQAKFMNSNAIKQS